MTAAPDPRRSVEQLTRSHWPDPPPGATRLVTVAHALRRRPVGELTVEQLRLLIGQRIDLPHLLPLALRVLRADPLAEGDLYPGDLLAAVLRCTAEDWSGCPGAEAEVRELARTSGIRP
ncbi:contact-dependent growth inhibition system immunity protein [Kitasatospora sp. NBC_00374]|uniref:contact-dependent growth inhibition system immunity protein n=1 Tax=Kitasatospora sp. NBC_00374 TaxID=2975964 RepID=UPI0030E186A7